MIYISIPEVRHMLGAIKRQLLDQLRAALREKEGGSGLGDLLGPALARSCRRSWIHFNLREVIQPLKKFLCFVQCCGSALVSVRILIQLFISMRIRGSSKPNQCGSGSESWSDFKVTKS
jgi:hypothetical protein